MPKHRGALSGVLALALVLTGGAAGAAVPDSAAAASWENAPAPASPRDHGVTAVRALLHKLTAVDGAPGALAATRKGRSSGVQTSGVADLESTAPVRGDSRFRIGSMTKPFVATVVLQLVGEHQVDLDAPIERYLPGLVRGPGGDGRQVTVRMLLQHTSGLPDYLTFLDPRAIIADPLAHQDTGELIELALGHEPAFEEDGAGPGDEWHYSNTNYLIAGMLIEKVTGRTYGEEIRRRILAPLHLSDTSVPGDTTSIQGPHPRGYVRPGENQPLIDITVFNPSVAGAAGEMISSGSDINRFLDALLGGRLLPPAQLRQMMHTRATGDEGREYGLGLERRELSSCHGTYWGHNGDIFGYQTAAGATTDGRQTTVMANVDPGGSDAQDDDMEALVQAGLCEGTSRTPGSSPS
ncbi:serine hydrolase domain-containing protein [Streptomyces sp. NPDC051784]|uniref:serine hydrolase domain-containing protein n=1 Tax=Streptomyces sp. NPDC051784 TaxID=3155805 RepID=UPI0034281D56